VLAFRANERGGRTARGGRAAAFSAAC